MQVNDGELEEIKLALLDKRASLEQGRDSLQMMGDALKAGGSVPPFESGEPGVAAAFKLASEMNERIARIGRLLDRVNQELGNAAEESR